MMAVNGWEMGAIESISITILVGLSVDYVVHLANSYIEADAADRQDRVAASFEEMVSDRSVESNSVCSL